MRVTKVIREYVEREVSAKFDPKIAEVGKDYSREKEELERRLKVLCEETEHKALEIAKSMGFDYIVSRYGGHRSGAVSITPHAFENEAKGAANAAACAALTSQKAKAIETILLNLELGETTKAELKSAIDAVKVES